VTTKPRLTVCGVTRNSGSRLEHWISRAREFADEVVLLVDASSHDDTAEVAESFADRVRVVEHPPFIELTMDYGLRQATGEWILWLDDDEFMAPAFADSLDALLTDPELTHYYLPCRWLVPTGNGGAGWLRTFPWYPNLALRLIRNVGSIYYHRGRLHSPIEVAGLGRVLDNDDVALYHFDLLWHDRAHRERKVSRYRGHPAPSCEEYYLYEDYASSLVIDPVSQDILNLAVPPPGQGSARRDGASRRDHGSPVVPLEELRARIGGHWVNADVFHAEYLDHTTPRRVLCNRGYTVELLIRNTSAVPWRNTSLGPPGRVYLSYHWIHPDHGMLLRDGDITILPAVVEPGAEIRVVAGLWTPYEPGRYQLQWDLRAEDVSWFSERGVDPLCVDVTADDKDRLLARPRQVASLPDRTSIDPPERDTHLDKAADPSRSSASGRTRVRARVMSDATARIRYLSRAVFGRWMTIGSAKRAADGLGASGGAAGDVSVPSDPSIAVLEQEVRFLRCRITQREDARARLNRSLHSPEQIESINRLDLARRLADAEAELAALRATKTFQYTARLRHWYAKWVLRRK